MNEQTDEQLVDAFRQTGEMHHFDELVGRHVNRVRAMIYPMVLNDADADELTQDVFLRVVKHLKGFKNKANFSTWLFRIAMNTTRSFLRHRVRQRVTHWETLPEQADPQPGAPRRLMAVEADAAMTEALAALPPRLRSAITLTAIQGMSAREAARVTGCPRATLYWRVHEARRQLKARLEKAGHTVSGGENHHE